MIGKVYRRFKKTTRKYTSLAEQNRKLRKFKNIHAGESCVIMGAGPSLNDIPDDFLDNLTVIGTNLSFKYYKPDYWVVIDAQYSWRDEGRKLCAENNIPAFINWLWAPAIPEKIFPNEVSLHPYIISLEQSPKNVKLKENLLKTYSNPKTIEKKGVTSVNSVVPEGAIPLAIYMGFSKIYLAGVDFYTPKSGKSHFMEDTDFDQEKIDKLTKRLQKESNSDRDLFDFKRWPIELVGQSAIKDRVFNLSEKSTVRFIPKINYKDVVV